MLNFISAIGSTFRMVRAMDKDEWRARYAIEAITHIIMAHLDENWGRRYPDLWKQDRGSENAQISAFISPKLHPIFRRVEGMIFLDLMVKNEAFISPIWGESKMARISLHLVRFS